MKLYYYLFYQLYKFWEFVSIPKFWSDFKAGISIATLEMWLVAGLINYYRIYIDQEIMLSKNFYVGIAVFVFGLNYLSFVYTNRWKEYNEEFDQLPRYKNIIGGFIVWIIIILITFSFWTSAYFVQKNVLNM